MTVLTLAVLLYGNATYYNDGIFERVWQYRQTYLPPCAECVGFAAMIDPADLGRKIWVTYHGETIGPLYVIDCAEAKHRANRKARGDVVEVEAWLGRRWHMDVLGRIPVVVSFAAPRRFDEPNPSLSPGARRTASR